MPCVSTRRLARGRQEGPVERRHRGVLAKGHAQHPERVVDQQRPVPADLVRVEEVLGPVVAGIGRRRSPAAARARRAPARPRGRPPARRSARLGGRSSSGQGSRNPMTTSAASRKRIGRRGARRRAGGGDERDRRGGEAEHGADASVATGLWRTRPGSSGASASPGRARGRPVTARVRGHRLPRRRVRRAPPRSRPVVVAGPCR